MIELLSVKTMKLKREQIKALREDIENDKSLKAHKAINVLQTGIYMLRGLDQRIVSLSEAESLQIEWGRLGELFGSLKVCLSEEMLVHGKVRLLQEPLWRDFREQFTLIIAKADDTPSDVK